MSLVSLVSADLLLFVALCYGRNITAVLGGVGVYSSGNLWNDLLQLRCASFSQCAVTDMRLLFPLLPLFGSCTVNVAVE
jgi:hypothetical protein